MMNFIPIFPLSLVAFPGENLNLHIFEPRYRQLIGECRDSGKPFGIPTVIKDRVSEMGTLMELVEVVKTYDDGKMDIRTRGLGVFRVLEIVPNVPEKLYGGAIVDYPENDTGSQPKLAKRILEGVRYLHGMLRLKKDLQVEEDRVLSYDMAHHAGLSLEQEYEFRSLLKEKQRLEYLRRHLQKVLPVVAEMEALKEKVRQNGHFKDLSGFRFEEGGKT